MSSEKIIKEIELIEEKYKNRFGISVGFDKKYIDEILDSPIYYNLGYIIIDFR